MLSKKLLIESGCSPDFAGEALIYTSLYSGDINKFIVVVEEMLECPRLSSKEEMDKEEKVIPAYDSLRGVKEVEKDYNGDLLDFHGYEFIKDNKRF